MPAKSGKARLAAGELEAATLAVLWRVDGWLTVNEARRALADEHPVAYTTVMTVLVRGWQKGVLDRRRQGRAFAYRPCLSAEESEAARMATLLAAFRSRPAALNLFVQSLDESEQEQLRTLLDAPQERG